MQKSKLFLLGLIVVGILLGSFHHHTDTLAGSECQVCIVQHSLDISGDVQGYTLEEIDTYFETHVSHENSYKKAFVYSHTLSRAPPSFS
jgi:hypothetical protein